MIDYSKRKIDYANRKPKPNNYDTLFQFRLGKNLKDDLYKFCEENKVSISKVIRNALEKYIKENNREEE